VHATQTVCASPTNEYPLLHLHHQPTLLVLLQTLQQMHLHPLRLSKETAWPPLLLPLLPLCLQQVLLLG
jgi:hypothetical protein